jgi:hypothetical protein
MEKVFILAFLVSVLYTFLKVLEMKYIEHDWKPLKEIVKDTLIVFICGCAAAFVTFHSDGKISDFLNVMTQTQVLSSAENQVFTGEPGF